MVYEIEAKHLLRDRNLKDLTTDFFCEHFISLDSLIARICYKGTFISQLYLPSELASSKSWH